VLATALLYTPGHAQGFTVVHNFGDGTDGAYPDAGLVGDSAGNIYGATGAGGTLGGGTIYQFDANENETVLYNFQKAFGNGGQVASITVLTGSWLLGTSAHGGNHDNDGTVFAQQISPPIHKQVHTFNLADGADPFGRLVLAGDGSTAYGVTLNGGANSAGEVYQIDRVGDFTVIYSFTGGLDGGRPTSLMLYSDGNLYGTTSSGGANSRGVIFKLDPAGNESVLHNFDDATGSGGVSTLLPDGLGNAYGTTQKGGGGVNGGGGVVYRVNLSTGDYAM